MCRNMPQYGSSAPWSPQQLLLNSWPLAVNVHLKDFTIKRASSSMGFVVEGAPACEGRLNIPHLIDRLRTFGREPNLILEQLG